MGIYILWKRDHKLREAHAFALNLYKLVKILHSQIEQLRAPKFYYRESVSKEIVEHYIPKIEELIFNRLPEIESEFIIVDKVLVKHKTLKKDFYKEIKEGVVDYIRKEIYVFMYNMRNNDSRDFNYEEQALWKIIFPAEQDLTEIEIKSSDLKPGFEVVNDEINTKFEKHFSTIYKKLEENMIL